jgi:WD40 repeat protein
VKRQRNKAQANYLVAQAQMKAAADPTLAIRLVEVAHRLGGAADAREVALQLYRECLFRKTVGQCAGSVLALAFTAGGERILAATHTGDLHVLDPNGRPPQTLWKAAERMDALAVSRDGERIAAAHGNVVQLLRPSGELDIVLAGHQDEVTAVAFSPVRIPCSSLFSLASI